MATFLKSGNKEANMKIEKFNDFFAILLAILIIAVWVVSGLGFISLPGEVIGALIAVFTLVAQFYFRRAPSNNGDK